MNNKVKKIVFRTSFGFFITAGAIVPLVLNMNFHKTSIERNISSNLKVYELSKPSSASALNSFSLSSVNLEKALYGSTSINGGNYMIGYMTLSNVQGSETIFDFPSTFNNWNWIQSLKMGTGNPVITSDLNHIYVNNAFLRAFFDESSGLSEVTKFYLAIDINPHISLQNGKNSKYVPERFSTPDSKWTQDLILDQFNYFHDNNPEDGNGNRVNAYGSRPFVDEFEDLPSSEQNKENRYIRNDSSAIAYRELTDFMKRWKPQTSSLTETSNLESGFIAYTQTRTHNESDSSLNNKIKPLITTTIGIDDTAVNDLITRLKSYYLNE